MHLGKRLAMLPRRDRITASPKEFRVITREAWKLILQRKHIISWNTEWERRLVQDRPAAQDLQILMVRYCSDHPLFPRLLPIVPNWSLGFLNAWLPPETYRQVEMVPGLNNNMTKGRVMYIPSYEECERHYHSITVEDAIGGL